MVTSAGKMRYGRKVRVSFDRSLIESYMLQKDKSVIDHNYEVTDAFLRSLPAPARPDQTDHHWQKVSALQVVGFLTQLEGHPALPASDPAKLAEYIIKKLDHGELTEWTVVLIDIASKRNNPGEVGGIKVGLPFRTPDPPKSSPETYYIKNRHVITMDDEMLDLSQEERERALASTAAQREAKKESERSSEPLKRPSGPYIRAERPKERGLLLIYPLDPGVEGLFDGDERAAGNPVIGYALSFPGTDHPDEAVEYLVNTVYFREEFGEE